MNSNLSMSDFLKDIDENVLVVRDYIKKLEDENKKLRTSRDTMFGIFLSTVLVECETNESFKDAMLPHLKKLFELSELESQDRYKTSTINDNYVTN